MNQQTVNADPYFHALKVSQLGTVEARQREQYLLRHNRCPNCNYFFGTYAAKHYDPKKKPIRCWRCGKKDPLAHVVDPLYSDT